MKETFYNSRRLAKILDYKSRWLRNILEKMKFVKKSKMPTPETGKEAPIPSTLNLDAHGREVHTLKGQAEDKSNETISPKSRWLRKILEIIKFVKKSKKHTLEELAEDKNNEIIFPIIIPQRSEIPKPNKHIKPSLNKTQSSPTTELRQNGIISIVKRSKKATQEVGKEASHPHTHSLDTHKKEDYAIKESTDSKSNKVLSSSITPKQDEEVKPNEHNKPALNIVQGGLPTGIKHMEKISIVKRRKMNAQVEGKRLIDTTSSSLDSHKKEGPEYEGLLKDDSNNLSFYLTSEQCKYIQSNEQIKSLLSGTQSNSSIDVLQSAIDILQSEDGHVVFRLNLDTMDAVKILNPEQVCKMLQIDKESLSELVEKEEIKSYKVGKFVRFSLNNILAYLTENKGY